MHCSVIVSVVALVDSIGSVDSIQLPSYLSSIECAGAFYTLSLAVWLDNKRQLAFRDDVAQRQLTLHIRSQKSALPKL